MALPPNAGDLIARSRTTPAILSSRSRSLILTVTVPRVGKPRFSTAVISTATVSLVGQAPLMSLLSTFSINLVLIGVGTAVGTILDNDIPTVDIKAGTDISGGSAGIAGLKNSFERIFDRRINFWDPTENLEIKSDKIDVQELKDHRGQLSVAIGLASRLTQE